MDDLESMLSSAPTGRPYAGRTITLGEMIPALPPMSMIAVGVTSTEPVAALIEVSKRYAYADAGAELTGGSGLHVTGVQ